jgi:hypothetical protein
VRNRTGSSCAKATEDRASEIAGGRGISNLEARSSNEETEYRIQETGDGNEAISSFVPPWARL